MMALGGDRDEQLGGNDDVWEEAEPAELDLDKDEPLPWLESSDYEEDESVSMGRIVGFGLLALAVLGLLIGGFAYLTNRGTDPELVADGSTIAAPDGAIKEKPADPGGKEFAGTGDVAPAVGEGQTREGRLADAASAPPAPRPSVDAPSAGQAPAEPAKGGAFVQVGALTSKAAADARWSELTRRTEALSGFRYRVEEAQIDTGAIYRLQAVAGDRAAANRLCDALKADGIECIVK
jgi:SPOR domain